MKYYAKINIGKRKFTLYEGRRRFVHNLVQKRAEYSGCQVIVTDYVEIEPGSQKEIICKEGEKLRPTEKIASVLEMGEQ